MVILMILIITMVLQIVILYIYIYIYTYGRPASAAGGPAPGRERWSWGELRGSQERTRLSFWTRHLEPVWASNTSHSEQSAVESLPQNYERGESPYILVGTKGVPRQGVWTSVNVRVWTCKELRVKRNQTSCYSRHPFLGTPVAPSRVGGEISESARCSWGSWAGVGWGFPLKSNVEIKKPPLKWNISKEVLWFGKKSFNCTRKSWNSKGMLA